MFRFFRQLQEREQAMLDARQEPVCGTLYLADFTGHSVLAEWTKERASQEVAKAEFDKIVAFNFVYGVRGEEREQLKTFDPTWPEIVATPVLVGG